MKISLVVPVHNEEAYLPYTLPAIRDNSHHLHEVIFVLDRCTDRSYDLISEHVPGALTYHIHNHRSNFFTAEAINYGFSIASGDYILLLGADCVLDSKIFSQLYDVFVENKYGGWVGIVSLAYKNFDLFSLRRRIQGIYIRRLSVRGSRHDSGLFCFPRHVLDSVGYLRDVITEYLDFYDRIRRDRLNVVHLKTDILHLRVGVTPRKQYVQGVAKFWLPLYGPFKTYLHAFLFLKPYTIIGYRHAKHYGVVEVGTLQ